MMEGIFEWDENKNLANIRKHGIDFLDARRVFSDPAAITFPSKGGRTEPRFLVVGRVGSRLVTVVFTMRGGRIRIISARRCRAQERRLYEYR